MQAKYFPLKKIYRYGKQHVEKREGNDGKRKPQSLNPTFLSTVGPFNSKTPSVVFPLPLSTLFPPITILPSSLRFILNSTQILRYTKFGPF